MSDLAGFFEAVQDGVRCFSFIAIAAVGGVQNIVDNLKCQTDTVAVDADTFKVGFGSSAEISPDPDTRADQGTGF